VIYLVDEDHLALQAWIAELKLRGHRVVILHNAADAFRELWQAPAEYIEAVFIDVMLAPGDLPGQPGADPGALAGLRLLRDLVQQNPAVFPRRAILLTNAVGPVLEEALACANQHGAALWDKRSILSSVHFGDRVQEFIDSRGAAE
jgi:hypothetical protein